MPMLSVSSFSLRQIWSFLGYGLPAQNGLDLTESKPTLLGLTFGDEDRPMHATLGKPYNGWLSDKSGGLQ
jgi:hypothetical protein